MSRRLIVRPEAEADAAEAHRWYEERRVGLGDEFFGVVDSAVDIIERRPEAFPRVHRGVRRVITRRFPFALFYVVTPDSVSILGILHQASDPDRWKRRL